MDNFSPSPQLAYAPPMLSDEDAEAERRKKLADAVAPLIQTLHAQAAEALQKRKPTEERWLKDLRQYHGRYEDEVWNVLQQEKSRSRLFINITRPKTNAWAARLGDMLFPNDERNWGIDPTPVPELTRTAREAAQEAEPVKEELAQTLEQHNAMVDQGEEGLPAEVAALEGKLAQFAEAEAKIQREIEIAKKTAAAMEREIDDQLTEARYPAKCRDVIEDFTKLGIGILKGPIVNARAPQSWGKDEQGSWGLKPVGNARPTWRRVDPWHFFPDPSASCIEEAEYNFERHLPNRKMLRKMARDLGFDKDAVRHLLKEGPKVAGASRSSDLGFMTSLRAMGGEETEGTTIDDLSDRYVVWEFSGALEADEVEKMILASGRYEDALEFTKRNDPLSPLMVRVFFCGSRLLKIEEDYLLDSGAPLYSVASFEKAEASILGAVGVPYLMRNEQAMLNSAMRMMMDNAGLAVGPQIVMDKDHIEPENGKWELSPRKIWRWIAGTGTKPDKPPFATYDIPMNQATLAAIVQLALRFIDEAVAMPLLSQGDQGEHHSKTKGGMAMLMGASNVVFRRVVKNWDDDVTAGTIARAYDFNMQFSDKDEIKGDMKVEARGTSVLLVREIQAEQLLTIVSQFSTHPILGVALKAYRTMWLVLQAMSINPNEVLLSEEDYLEKLKQMSESDGTPSDEQIRADTQLKVAQMDQDTRLQVGQMNQQIAQMRLQGDMVKLANEREMTVEQIQAMFDKALLDAQTKAGIAAEKEQSAERRLAVEVAVEKENAADARARGLEPTGSGGAVSMGGEQP